MTEFFSKFTNLYELSKTLRFELKPIGETADLLNKNKIIEIDKARKKNYQKLKPHFDRLHLEFVSYALKDSNLDFQEYAQRYKARKKDKENKELEKKKKVEEKKLREEIVKYFDQKTEEYLKQYPNISFSKKNKDFLYEIGFFSLLKEKFGNDENEQIFEGWKGWLGYFDKFFNTRKNLYKSDGTPTAIATRIINDNLKIFIDMSRRAAPWEEDCNQKHLWYFQRCFL